MKLKVAIVALAAAAFAASGALAQTMQPIPNPPEKDHHHGKMHHRMHHHPAHHDAAPKGDMHDDHAPK